MRTARAILLFCLGALVLVLGALGEVKPALIVIGLVLMGVIPPSIIYDLVPRRERTVERTVERHFLRDRSPDPPEEDEPPPS